MQQVVKTGLIVALGGGLGSLLRYLAAMTVGRFHTGSFPTGTLVVNVVGCLMIGGLAGALDVKGVDPAHAVRLFLLTGILGGFTTFSAFGYETLVLLRSDLHMAALNVFLQLVLGIGAAALGFGLAHVIGRA